MIIQNCIYSMGHAQKICIGWSGDRGGGGKIKQITPSPNPKLKKTFSLYNRVQFEKIREEGD